MSWSVSANGRPAAVVKKINDNLAHSRCMEPEETIKKRAVAVINECLSHFPPEHPVTVEASGSQSTDSTKPDKAVNQLTISIRPIWGFVE